MGNGAGSGERQGASRGGEGRAAETASGSGSSASHWGDRQWLANVQAYERGAAVLRKERAAEKAATEPAAEPGQWRARLQRKGAGGPASDDADSVHRAAAHGTSGASQPLPYADRIQASFGHHDVSRVQAHSDGAAAQGAQAMGARAFASGDHVAFDGTPDLHTAAHEAAHVVQQRAGVHLKGGVGQAGDAYEQHADAVADRVVQGKSAVDLLDAYAPTGGGAAVQRKDKPKPKTAAPVVFTVDGNGDLHDTHGDLVGFRAADGKSYAGVDAKGQKGVALSAARLGTLHLDANKVIVSVEEVTLAAVPAVDAVSGGTTPDPAKTAEQRSATFGGTPLGLLDHDGSQVLKRAGKGWEPVDPDAMPAAIKGKLNEQSRIDLDDGQLWVWMSFSLRDEKADKARWVPPGHSKAEVASRQKDIEAEAGKLPKDSDVKAAIDRLIQTVALVSTVEGGFGSTSPSFDTAASVGIFQWAMSKGASADAGSLGMFFRALKERAATAAAKAEKDRTDEEKLYVSAWKQCTDHGLDVNGKQILLNGQPATGGEVESTMSGEMGKGSLRTYQLVAAKDWIDQFRGTVVRPGPVGASLIGHGYRENGDGTSATLSYGLDSIELSADKPATVGSLFASEKAVANAIMLGVNRPHYVETSLWRALSPGSNPSNEADALLKQLMTAMQPAQSAPVASSAPQKAKPPAPHKYTAADVAAAGADAQRLYAQLQALIWPNRALDAGAQQKLEAEFKKQAMKLYSPADARRFNRERRFSTVDAANW